MSATEISTIILAGCASVALIAGMFAWFFRRGGAERDLARAVRENSDATRILTSRLEAFMIRYEERHEALSDRVNGHETRLGVAETRIRSNTIDIARLWPSPGTNRPQGEPAAETELL